jgi:hypothetical protein
VPRTVKPQGQPTRGKTAHNRLRRVDTFITRYDPALIRQPDPADGPALFVDLGFGAEPATTLESAARFRKINPRLKILGVEIDPDRVAAARPYQAPGIEFRLGGFNLPLHPGETVRLIRAFNVLRQYQFEEVFPACLLLVQHLVPGGLLVEGTSDPFGRIWSANLLRPDAGDRILYEALVFSTSFRAGSLPADFQPVLPKNLIHKMEDPGPIREFIHAWKAAAHERYGYQTFGQRIWFAETAQALARRGYSIDIRKKFLRDGYLVWKHPPLTLE